jgi:23S rRNA (pseudouridine1915-N3)-methyltransferase
MKLLLLTVGKSALPYAKAGRDEYLERLTRFAPVAKVTVKASNPARESSGLLELSEGCLRVVLHERGTALTSRALAAKIDEWRLSSRRIALIIGGADGHDQPLLDAADFIWSLGPLTLQHELALVVALEQLYRAHTILTGHPYHRD